MFNQREDVALLLGRLFVASMFLPSGIEKLMSFSKFTAFLAGKGFPYAKIWAVFGVAVEVLGPIALIVGAWSRYTAIALMLFTLMMTWATYRSAVFGVAFRQPQNPQFFKNVAVMAGLLFYFVSGPGNFSWRPGPSAERA